MSESRDALPSQERRTYGLVFAGWLLLAIEGHRPWLHGPFSFDRGFVRYDANEVMGGVTEVLCYGTAVTVEPLSGVAERT